MVRTPRAEPDPDRQGAEGNAGLEPRVLECLGPGPHHGSVDGRAALPVVAFPAAGQTGLQGRVQEHDRRPLGAGDRGLFVRLILHGAQHRRGFDRRRTRFRDAAAVGRLRLVVRAGLLLVLALPSHPVDLVLDALAFPFQSDQPDPSLHVLVTSV